MFPPWLPAMAFRALQPLAWLRVRVRAASPKVWLATVPILLSLLWAYLRRAARRHLLASSLCLTAPLRAAGVKYATPLKPLRGWDGWQASCPCCKRPLEIELLSTPPQRPAVAPEATGRYAFLICLWGASAEYMVGAMVLGASIRKTGSKHHRVCLYTDDVPQEHIRELSKLWRCKLITHVDAVMDQLSFPDKEERFAKVFTKLRGLGLTEYEKVLMMDIDLLVRSNIDDLFELPAPAALRRGMNEWGLAQHGKPIDGRSFLLGEDKSMPRWSWGQGTGINAGVMLWQPNQDVLDQMLAELSEPNHPEHVKGNGPEQDYLSRYWADAPWTYIGAQYNFQLHQMFFALHPDRVQYAERANLLQNPENIKIVHYSGKPTAKPWHRVLDETWKEFWPSRARDEEYVKLFAEEFMGYWLWVKRDPKIFESHASGWDMAGIELNEDGEYQRRTGEQVEWLPIPESISGGAMQLLSSVLTEWFDLFQSLETEFGFQPTLLSTSGPRVRAGPVGRELRLKNTMWKRPFRAGWWTEAEKTEKGGEAAAGAGSEGLVKLTVSCSTSSEANFVSLRDSTSVYEEQGFDVSGLYIKLEGQTAARTFSLDNLSPDGLLPVHLWVDSVPVGAIVLMAIVSDGERALGDVLQALAPLGVPQAAPPPNTQALACISMAGTEGHDVPCANHASPDVAYASVLFDPTGS
ncbi:unnamed protein product [Durusdinium trenchii]|uniref:Uncharacterized protein n=2 Tax=Durusdinium trenchii TaxID=1381693 RepID=A0ABP0MJ05_9DINO